MRRTDISHRSESSGPSKPWAARLTPWALLFTMLGVLACSSSARIRLRNGASVDGRIHRHTDGELEIENARGEIRHIDDRDIADIEHPGLPAIVLGGLLAAAGGALVVDAASTECEPAQYFDVCPSVKNAETGLGFLAGALGIGTFTWGLTTHIESRSHEVPTKSEPTDEAPPVADAERGALPAKATPRHTGRVEPLLP